MHFSSFLPSRFLRRNPKRPSTSPTSMVCNGKFGNSNSSPMKIEYLPLEILQLVAGFLAPDSAACFALCSKSLLWAIGNQSWYELQTKDQKEARLKFLVLLQRDLRELLLCYHCEKLYHSNLKQSSNTLWFSQNEHPCTYADGFLFFFPGFGFRFQYAQMLMKLYRSGATEHMSLESLSHAVSYKDVHNFLQRHVSCRIANDNLLVRQEWRILLRHGDDSERISTVCQQVCPHWKSILDYNHLAKRVHCQMSHGLGQSCSECTGLVQCQFCSTEFIVASLDSNWSPGGQAIYITSWKNLGSCKTPFDSRWRDHLFCIDTSIFTPTKLAPFVPGSVRSAFEDRADFKIGVGGLSTRWPIDSDAQFLRLVVGNSK